MNDNPNIAGQGPREIAPFKPETTAADFDDSCDENAMVFDEIQNMLFASSTLLMEKNDNSPEIRAVLTLLGAVQKQISSLHSAGAQ